jgi:hypothetical protein
MKVNVNSPVPLTFIVNNSIFSSLFLDFLSRIKFQLPTADTGLVISFPLLEKNLKKSVVSRTGPESNPQLLELGPLLARWQRILCY